MSIRVPIVLATSVAVFAAIGPFLPGGFLAFAGYNTTLFWSVGGPPAAIAGLLFGIVIVLTQPYIGAPRQVDRLVVAIAAACLGAISGAFGIAIWSLLVGVAKDAHAFEFYRALFVIGSGAGAVCGVIALAAITIAQRLHAHNGA